MIELEISQQNQAVCSLCDGFCTLHTNATRSLILNNAKLQKDSIEDAYSTSNSQATGGQNIHKEPEDNVLEVMQIEETPEDVDGQVERNVEKEKTTSSKRGRSKEIQGRVGARLKIGKLLNNFFPEMRKYIIRTNPHHPNLLPINRKILPTILKDYPNEAYAYLTIKAYQYIPKQQPKTDSGRNQVHKKKCQKMRALEIIEKYPKIVPTPPPRP